MKQTPIVFRIDQGNYHAVFSLRQIRVSDDSDYLQQFINAEEDKDEQYKANVEALAAWAEPFPEVKGKDGVIARPDDALDSEEAVRKFFEDADVDKEWIAEYAIRSIRARHSPSVSFF